MWKADRSLAFTAEQRAALARAQFIAAVKAECGRRIVAVMPQHKQINNLAQHAEASMLYGDNPAAWPEDLRAKQVAAMPLWAEINRLRARSDEIEAMEPSPTDISDNTLWAFTP